MSLPQDTPEQVRRLEFTKGVISFEGHPVQVLTDSIINSPITKRFLDRVVPKAQPEAWLRKQQLIVNDMPTVAGLLLFADEPQAVLPKRCGIKVYRYKTQEETGFRDVLSFIPITVEGCLYDQIKEAVEVTVGEIEKIKRMGESGLEQVNYPPETPTKLLPTRQSIGTTASPTISTCAFLTIELRFKVRDDYLLTSPPGTFWMNASRETEQSFACLISFPIRQIAMLVKV
jgi:hypothetical protein